MKGPAPRLFYIMRALIESEYEILAHGILALQSPIIMSVARERYSSWSSDSVSDACTESRDHSHSSSKGLG